jgi:hypothetical protein
MGLYAAYTCSIEAKESIPRLLQLSEISVVSCPVSKKASALLIDPFALICSRGSERVRLFGDYDSDQREVIFYSACVFSWRWLFFWHEERNLISDIDSVLRGTGLFQDPMDLPDAANEHDQE